MIRCSSVMASIGLTLLLVGLVTSAQALSVSPDPLPKAKHNNLTPESVSRSGRPRPPHPGGVARIAKEKVEDVHFNGSEGSL